MVWWRLGALDKTNIPIIHGLNTKRPIKINSGHYFSLDSKSPKIDSFNYSPDPGHIRQPLGSGTGREVELLMSPYLK